MYDQIKDQQVIQGKTYLKKIDLLKNQKLNTL